MREDVPVSWSVLVANRGEIAVRIIRTCRELGVRTIAVYSPIDRWALHVRRADEAYPLPGDPPASSYLNIAALLDVAHKAKAHAVHPGYGFLAENATFAGACESAGLTFVGPTSAGLALCGDKAQTRERVASAGIPLLPGTAPLRDEAVSAAAAQVGFPLLLKAVAGGGGKGIHVVRTREELPATLRLARGEANSAFGDDRIYLERYLEGARHVEIQLLAERSGEVHVLGERDCTIQRRHQKLIEETPAVGLAPTLRARMADAAIAIAKTIGYQNAGTIEFLVHDEAFYFLEVNARLQVEHPVTEVVTGLDLVAEQFRVARGERPGPGVLKARPSGHGLECRISAEDPHEGFLPVSGVVEGVIEPAGPWVRVDSGLYEGMTVTHHYDPLLAKVIAWAPTREGAIARMQRALEEMIVAGVPTTIPFHRWALADDAFRAGRHDARFPGRWEARIPRGENERLAVLVAAAVTEQDSRRIRFPPTTPDSVWGRAAREEGLR